MKDDRLYLYPMLERCQHIGRFAAPGPQKFAVSEEMQDAVIRNIEVIGEAVSTLPGRVSVPG